MSKAIYKFHWDCGRMGDVFGVFAADKKDVERAIGKHIDFGEALGKHSKICGTLKEDHLEQITTDKGFIELFEQHDLSSGYNPLNYLEEEE